MLLGSLPAVQPTRAAAAPRHTLVPCAQRALASSWRSRDRTPRLQEPQGVIKGPNAPRWSLAWAPTHPKSRGPSADPAFDPLQPLGGLRYGAIALKLLLKAL